MKRNVLFIGGKGYLGKHLINELNTYTITLFDGRVENIKDFDKYKSQSFDYIFHFGSTNNERSNTSTIIPGTHNVIHFANFIKAKLIYASTKGILQAHNIYEKNKKESTVILLNTCDKYVCLIIPRVYSKDRNSGLIYAIKNNLPLDNKRIEYLNIECFVKQTINSLKYNKICYHYNNLKYNTIQEIKELMT